MRFSLLLFLFHCAILNVQSFGQELWGVANSNYSGAMGHDLNPAAIVGTPFNWELHVLSVDASLMNNYMYLQRNSKAFAFAEVINNYRHSQVFKSGLSNEGVNEEDFKIKYLSNDKSTNLNLAAKWPSFMVSNKKWGLGFHVSTRMALSATGIPYHLANFMREGFDFKDQQHINYTIENMDIVAMNWQEAGITAGMTLLRTPSSYLTGGITLNYLYGLNGLFVNLENVNYFVPADTLWEIDLASLEYGYDVADDGSKTLQKNGDGFSTSIGVQYLHNRNDAAYENCISGQHLKKYDYKIGFSIIDIGWINFNRHPTTFRLNDFATSWYGIDTIRLTGIHNADSILNNQLFGPILSGRSHESFNLWMPAAASLQFDYAFMPSFYLNFS